MYNAKTDKRGVCLFLGIKFLIIFLRILLIQLDRKELPFVRENLQFMDFFSERKMKSVNWMKQNFTNEKYYKIETKILNSFKCKFTLKGLY